VMPCFSEMDRSFTTISTWSPLRASKQGTDNRTGPRSNRTARKRPETAINRRKTARNGGRNPSVQKCI
jgi:hypothetical protein